MRNWELEVGMILNLIENDMNNMKNNVCQYMYRCHVQLKPKLFSITFNSNTFNCFYISFGLVPTSITIDTRGYSKSRTHPIHVTKNELESLLYQVYKRNIVNTHLNIFHFFLFCVDFGYAMLFD